MTRKRPMTVATRGITFRDFLIFQVKLVLDGAKDVTVLERLDQEEGEDGLFGASEAGTDNLLGQIEQLVRGGDEPRKPEGGA
jgi:hypothetical protein